MRRKPGSVLRAVPLFDACTDRDVARIASIADEIHVESGETLTEEGRPGREFFVVVSGRAAVTKKGRRVGSLGRGDFFGELAILDPGPRTATVRAETRMTLLVLDGRAFASLLDRVPLLARKMLRGLASRLREAERAHTH